MLTVKREDYRNTHRYTATDQNGRVVMERGAGCTTICNVIAKEPLIIAAARQARRHAIAELTSAVASHGGQAIERARIDEIVAQMLEGDGYADVRGAWSVKADRGSDLHSAAEALALRYRDAGHIDEGAVREACEAHVEPEDEVLVRQYATWLESLQPVVLGVEEMFACPTCHVGGTADIRMRIPRYGDGEWIADIKTGKVWDDRKCTRIYDSIALQLSGLDHLAYMTEAWDPGLACDDRPHRQLAVIHLSADANPSRHPLSAPGVEWIPSPSTETNLDAWFRCRDLYHWRFNKAWAEEDAA